MLQEKLSSLDSDSTLAEVEEVIQNHYIKNPAPEAINNPNINITDVFPHLKQQKKYDKNLNLNQLVNEAKLAVDEKLFTFRTDNSMVQVVLAETGDIVILESESKPAVVESENNNRGIKLDANTRIQRNTGIAYNASGGKMFTIWAEGQFKYDGKKVSAIHNDGNWQRHFWGSTLYTDSRGMGKIRSYSLEEYNYCEVYSRLYYESTWGIRWAGIALSSDIVEIFVGSTANGSIYGGAVRP